MESWRDRARKQMKTRGVTQEALAEALEMTQGGVQHWLAGTRQPSLQDIDRIAAVIGVHGAWLTHGIDDSSSVEGLGEPAERALRALIAHQRAGRLQPNFWATVTGMLELAAPTPPPGAGSNIKSPEEPRNGTHD